jgi:hypothetical protein
MSRADPYAFSDPYAFFALYNFDAELICKKVIIEKLAYGRGYIDWQ